MGCAAEIVKNPVGQFSNLWPTKLVPSTSFYILFVAGVAFACIDFSNDVLGWILPSLPYPDNIPSWHSLCSPESLHVFCGARWVANPCACPPCQAHPFQNLSKAPPRLHPGVGVKVSLLKKDPDVKFMEAKSLKWHACQHVNGTIGKGACKEALVQVGYVWRSSRAVRVFVHSHQHFEQIHLLENPPCSQLVILMSNDKPAAPCCCKTLLEIAKRAVSETRLVDAQAKKSRLKIDEVTCLVGYLNGHIQPAMASTREVSGKLKWHAFLDPAQFNLLDVFCCEHSVNISELSDQRAASVLLPIMWWKPMIPAFDTCIPTEKSCPPIVKDDWLVKRHGQRRGIPRCDCWAAPSHKFSTANSWALKRLPGCKTAWDRRTRAHHWARLELRIWFLHFLEASHFWVEPDSLIYIFTNLLWVLWSAPQHIKVVICLFTMRIDKPGSSSGPSKRGSLMALCGAKFNAKWLQHSHPMLALDGNWRDKVFTGLEWIG